LLAGQNQGCGEEEVIEGWKESNAMIIEEFKRHPDAFAAVREFFGIEKASLETTARYIFTFGSEYKWWATVGVPHLKHLCTKRGGEPSERGAIAFLMELLDAGMLKRYTL
jgi:hypothetical protein